MRYTSMTFKQFMITNVTSALRLVQTSLFFWPACSVFRQTRRQFSNGPQLLNVSSENDSENVVLLSQCSFLFVMLRVFGPHDCDHPNLHQDAIIKSLRQ